MTEDKTPINWRNVCRRLLALVVGSIAAIQSYDHQSKLAHGHGQHGFMGSLFPIIVDVLILYAAVAMDGRNRFLPRLAFWAGVGVTISANVLAAPPDLLSRLISAWAPIALLLVIENEAWRNKISRVRLRKAAEVSASNTEAVSVGASELTSNAISTEEPKPRTPNSRGKATANKVAKAAARVAKRNPEPTRALIAAEAGVSESTVRRVLPPVAPSQPTPEPVSVPA